MRSRSRRRTATLAVLGLLAGLLPTLFGASPASAGTTTSPMSCTNSVQAGTTSIPNTVTGLASPNPIELGSGQVSLSGATFGLDVPGGVALQGYALNFLTVGVNTIPADIVVTLKATNTAEGTQVLPPMSVTGETTIADPTPPPGGLKTDGDETATPIAISASLPTSTWTPTGGPIAFSLEASATTAMVGPGGIIAVTFSCTPGTPTPAGCGAAPLLPCTGTSPVPALPFDTVVVNAPPTAPVCTDEAPISVGITQTVPINLVDNCTDVNADIDLSTFTVSTPSAGILTGSDGVYSYEAPATDPGGPVELDFTVEDAGGLVSNIGAVTITILANSCDATSTPCSLTEIVVQPVVGTTMSLAKVAGVVQMSQITLNGNSQASEGSLQDVTVTNARGTSSSWTLSGFITDLSTPDGPYVTLPASLGGQTVPACSAAGSAGQQPAPDRLCIPGDNMGWSPTAAVAHDVIFGDVADVDAGTPDAVDATDWILQLRAAGAAGLDGLGGLQDYDMLCQGPEDRSGGTFACDASLFLGVPASAGAGVYGGGLVLTLL